MNFFLFWENLFVFDAYDDSKHAPDTKHETAGTSITFCLYARLFYW